ncbi:hypothetical protein HMPREF9996_00238 [Aggregatibacter actinomycetemcomitans Y4]|nr:hypothetical protein HMPREF9996_00238 [Aggregatibacter actinomycetemcomitans Y4]
MRFVIGIYRSLALKLRRIIPHFAIKVRLFLVMFFDEQYGISI